MLMCHKETSGPGSICYLQWAATATAAINFPIFYFFLSCPRFMFCCSSWGLMCFPVLSIFLFECVLIFSCWSRCRPKVPAYLTAAWREVLSGCRRQVQHGWQCRRLSETSLGRAALCLLSLCVHLPLQLGCWERVMDNADFWNGDLVFWMWKYAVRFHTWKLFMERSEMFPFMHIRWTFFAWLQTFFFFNTWWLLPICAYSNWRHLHSKVRRRQRLEAYLIWVGLLFLVLAHCNHSAYCCISIDCRQTSWGITLPSLSFKKEKRPVSSPAACEDRQICNADCLLRLKVCHCEL